MGDREAITADRGTEDRRSRAAAEWLVDLDERWDRRRQADEYRGLRPSPDG